jgi:hypothetical protein
MSALHPQGPFCTELSIK